MTKVTLPHVCSARHELEPCDSLLMSAKAVCDDVCDELDRADPENNEYCLVLSNFADDCYAFISGMKRCREP
jgi:hypothetical protein